MPLDVPRHALAIRPSDLVPPEPPRLASARIRHRTSATAGRLADLLAESARGDQAAFASLYVLTHGEAYAVAMRILRSPDHAVEVTQEAYLEAWLKSGAFDPTRGTVSGWLTMIVRRRAIDRVRHVTSANARDQRTVQQEQAVHHVDVADEVAARIDAQQVRGALTALTAIQREVIRLRYFEGHSLAEVATELNLPIGTVKTRLRDGLIRLRRNLQGPVLECA